MDWTLWEPRFERFLRDEADAPADPAHDLAHIRRVVRTARRLADAEHADLKVVLPAAWLHDCAQVPKDSPDRQNASGQAARRAWHFLADAGYPHASLDDVAHAIEAHSYSAGVPPRTLEACVVQDADRLDALGAVGIARCFMVGGALGHALSHPEQPLPHGRTADDERFSLDHFFTKLLDLPDQMQTPAGRSEAQRRAAFMREYLDQFEREAAPPG